MLTFEDIVEARRKYLEWAGKPIDRNPIPITFSFNGEIIYEGSYKSYGEAS